MTAKDLLNITKENSENGFYQTLVTTFTAVFLAELGDKTQIATFMLSAETGRPFIVFIAAATALILSSLMEVAIGSVLSKRINPRTLNTVAGFLMITISLFMLFEIIEGNNILTNILK
ncbi:TMEM165/GDT1 family protein [Prochlorococcus marinus]|uniref:TMEM165/GDT1 family protein n=1 Tax=Prochlorococcus marinus TaxID=1219 RepID=UPI0005338EF2|nr:TMEM165/GDT1 family protein [Prochlorococcus marinus]KGG18962.1 hypothetical protein EV08_1449 [Prochlorococcus marinus str. SS2]